MRVRANAGCSAGPEVSDGGHPQNRREPGKTHGVYDAGVPALTANALMAGGEVLFVLGNRRLHACAELDELGLKVEAQPSRLLEGGRSFALSEAGGAAPSRAHLHPGGIYLRRSELPEIPLRALRKGRHDGPSFGEGAPESPSLSLWVCKNLGEPQAIFLRYLIVLELSHFMSLSFQACNVRGISVVLYT